MVVLLLASFIILVEIFGVVMKGEYPIWQSVLWYKKKPVWVNARDLNSDN